MRARFVFLFLFFIATASFADNNYIAQSKKNVQIEQQLYQERLDDVEDILTGKTELTESQYDTLRKETLDVIDALEKLKSRIVQKIQRSSGDGKKELEQQLGDINDTINRAQIQLQIINKEKIHVKAKTLTTVHNPLYKTGVLRQSLNGALMSASALFTQINTSAINLFKWIFEKPRIGFWLLFMIALTGSYVICIVLRKEWSYFLKPQENISHLKKIRALFTVLITDRVIPLTVVYVTGYIAYMQNVITIEATYLNGFFILVVFLLLLNRFIKGFFYPDDFEWALCHIEKKRAKYLGRRTSILAVLVGIRCYLSFLSEPIEFIQLLLFFFHMLILFQLFFTLKVSNVHPFYKYTLITIALVMPVCIFIGLGALADLLFIGTISTVFIFLTLKAVHYLIKQTVIFFVRRHHELIGKVNFGEKSFQIITYWINAFLILILFLVGTYFTLISWGIDPDYLDDLVSRLIFGFHIGSHTLSLLNIVLAVVVFLFFFSLTRYLQNLLAKHVFPYTTLDSGLKHALKTTTGYIGFAFAIIFTIKTIGFDLSSILFVLGGLSVGIGLGLQPIVTNFISGLVMLLERPIKIGDLIELGGELGVVRRINVRTTEVETTDRASILFPNSHIINNVVKNWTKHDRIRKTQVVVGFSCDSDVKFVEELLLKCANKVPEVLKDPAPVVFFNDIDSSSLVFILKFAIAEATDNQSICAKVRSAIYKELEQLGITLPFPQQDVHFDKAFIEAISKKDCK